LIVFSETKSEREISEKEKEFRGGLSYSAPQEKRRHKGRCHYPASVPSLKKNVEFRDWMGLKLGNGISPCFFTF